MKNLLINRALAAKKHKLFALFLALVAGIGTVLAQCTDVNSDIRINGIYYLFDSSTLTAAVASPCHENGYSGAVIIPSTVTYQGKTYDVTKILFTAFYYNNNLKSVTIPNSVVEVGGLAFSNCPNLTSVNFPNSITEINYTYPYVDNCPSLTSPIYNQHFFMYLPTSYSGAYTIPDGIEIINCSAFCGCTSLTSIEIPNSVTSIGWSAFKNCSSLTSIEIPNSVTSIGMSAFYGCTGLTSVTIPNSVTSIGRSAFYGCTGLTSVTIPNSVTSIGEYAFDNCSSLTSIYVPCGEIDRFKQMLSAYGDKVQYAPLPYNLTILSSELGQIKTSDICEEFLMTAVPNYGYHFTQWSDGITENPRMITFSKDTTFAAEYAKNTYSIETQANNQGWGTTAGDGAALYQEQLQISATPNYGYHFVQWNDGNTENPRSVVLTQDTTFTVTFAKNVYSITKVANSTQGSISGASQAEYLDNVELTAVPNYGYHFTKWLDGNIDNPRSFVITGDTTFTAEFAKNTYTITTSSTNSEWGTTSGGGAALYQEQLQISATPNYGYHFDHWNDGNTANPRTVTVTEDKTYQAIFAKNVYSVIKVANSTQGTISGASQAEYLDNVELTAVPNYGYHFTKWLDGNIDNPRSFVITGDTTFTAEFAKNTYTITTSSTNSEWGTTSGGGAALYQEQLQISATPNYGYHFDHWNDGNTANPRTVTVTEDKTYQAIFAKNVYSVIKVANSTQGTISGASQAEYLDNVELTATSNYGYYFAQWSDGVMENPRSFVITRDTTFTAEFALDRTGTCGNNLALTWTYNPEKKVLTIEGNGAFVENIQCGVEARPILEKVIIGKGVTAMNSAAFTGCPNLTAVEWNATDGGDCTACPFPTSVTSVTLSNGVEHIPAYLCNGLTGITSIVIPSSVKSIGDYAFANINSRKINDIVLPSEIISIGDYAFAGNTYIEQIDFGKSLEFIGAYAFQGCSRVMTMTCLAEMTPDVGTDGLASISSNADLYVLSSALRKYQVDPNWSRFLLKELGAKEETTINQVIVVPGDNIAIFTWPTTDGAGSYTIQITKDGELVCTLIFNSNGQLTGIAFAPSRDGTATAPAATLSVAGMSFTVTGLNSASKYAYSLAVADDDNKELVSYHGEFATTGYEGEVTPGGEPERPGGGGTTSVDQLNVQSSMSNVKYIKDGQLFIRQGDKIFNAHGARVK